MSALHVPLQVGDRVQLTGTVEDVGSVAAVRIDGAGHRPYSFPTEALTVPPWPGAVLSGCVDEEENERMVWFKRGRKSAEAQVAALTARLAALPAVPDGSEVLVVPSKTVDAVRAARSERDFAQVWSEIDIAASAAVDRRPKPEPHTERVPWWEAVGLRRRMNDAFGFEFTVEAAAWDEDENLNVENRDGSRTFPVDFDGTVEVLVDGEP